VFSAKQPVKLEAALIDLICLRCWSEHSRSELCRFREVIEATLTGNMHNACAADDW